MEACVDVARSHYLELLRRLQQEAALGHFDWDPLAVAQPDEQSGEARLSVDREEADVSVSSDYRSESLRARR